MIPGLTALGRGLERLRHTHGERFAVGGVAFSAVRQEREARDAMGDPVVETTLLAARRQFRTLPPQGATINGPDGTQYRLTGIRPGPVHHVHLVVTAEPR
jgi:hypothetical protein